MQRRGGKVWNLEGEPLGFIGATDAKRATIHLDLCAYHNTPPRHIVGYASVIPILSHQSRAGHFAFLGRPGLFPQRGYGSKSVPPARLGPGVRGLAHQWFRRPSQGSLTMKDGPTNGQNLGT